MLLNNIYFGFFGSLDYIITPGEYHFQYVHIVKTRIYELGEIYNEAVYESQRP